MIDDQVREAIESRKGFVVIMAGSDSDLEHIGKITKELDDYEIPHETRIFSAHKQPGELEHVIGEYNAIPGKVAYIAVAGGVDALSGTLSYHALAPVISCPPDPRNESCLDNPPGSSNAYVEKPANAARFAAQIFAEANPHVRNILEGKIAEKIAKQRKADEANRGYQGGQK